MAWLLYACVSATTSPSPVSKSPSCSGVWPYGFTKNTNSSTLWQSPILKEALQGLWLEGQQSWVSSYPLPISCMAVWWLFCLFPDHKKKFLDKITWGCHALCKYPMIIHYSTGKNFTQLPDLLCIVNCCHLCPAHLSTFQWCGELRQSQGVSTWTGWKLLACIATESILSLTRK